MRYINIYLFIYLYEDGFSIHANRPLAHLKTSYKRKNLPEQLKAGKIKKNYLKADQCYTKAKWPTRRRLKIHPHKPTTSTQSSHLQELSSHYPFDHVIWKTDKVF